MFRSRGLLSAVLLALASPVALAPTGPMLVGVDLTATPMIAPRRQRRGRAQSGRYRSKGPQAHRPRKANRNTIGKRVRRKHRRAA